jgi:hypothetical protein
VIGAIVAAGVSLAEKDVDEMRPVTIFGVEPA